MQVTFECTRVGEFQGPQTMGPLLRWGSFTRPGRGKREGPGGALTAHVIPPLSAFIFHTVISAWWRRDGDVHRHTNSNQHLSWHPHHNPIEMCWCGTPDYVFFSSMQSLQTYTHTVGSQPEWAAGLYKGQWLWLSLHGIWNPQNVLQTSMNSTPVIQQERQMCCVCFFIFWLILKRFN